MLSFLLLVQSSSFGFAFKLYSENSFRQHNDVLAHVLNLRAIEPIEEHLSTYLTTGEEFLRALGQLDKHSSFSYLGAGVQYSKGPFFLSLEGRKRFYFENQALWNSFDVRALLSYNRFLELVRFQKELRLFFETYEEISFSSNDNDNVVLNGLARIGLRREWARGFSSDILIEPNLLLDANQNDYNSTLGIRPTLRASYTFDTFTTQLYIAWIESFSLLPNHILQPFLSSPRVLWVVSLQL